ncbi:hypothetical protein QLQ12_24100 [Actinoplanes sp. NEAU-A12]|uniref:Uncharacterized protein n=1 Tax=Actinoplanes sandaracinus TaxID=3045177 RepID=A0ABT6WPR2_9ACTN|nr:hypothetical protein [Actinoplanes sandaracinus]MDI6101708.1 hypothetical protein [Actinoplanes sandaracinus]
MHDSVYDVAGDPRKAELLRMSLDRIAEGPDGPLREMAREVLAGRADLRAATREAAYGDELSKAFGRFWGDYQAMSPAERDQLVQDTRQRVDELFDEPRPH